jgi:hypothetical protein
MATPSTFTVGKDCNLVLTSPYGSNITMPLLTTIKVMPEYNSPRSDPLNTYPIERNLPKGWRVTMDFDRSGSGVDQLFSQIEAGWWAGGTPDGGTNAAASIWLYVTEPTGGVTTYQYIGASLKLANGGDISVDNPVKMSIEAFAQTRVVT